MNLFKVIRSFSTAISLHPYLELNLKAKKFLPLKNIQLQAFDKSQKEKHILINELDGSGKTLAYLIPILNEAFIRKTEKREALRAIIVTPNKQLVLQIYQLIRGLDPENVLTVNRSGSITYYSPVIDQMCKPSKQQDNDLIVDLMNKNVVDSVRWDKTDILITTPKIFYRILDAKKEEKKRTNPGYLVLDQIDVILQSSNLLNYANQGIEYILNSAGKSSSTTKFILASHHLEIMKLLKEKETVMPKAQQLAVVNTFNSENRLKDVKISYIKIKNKDKQAVKNEKLEQLTKIMANPQRKRVIIYCDKENVERIRIQMLQNLKVTPSQMYASLSTQKRMLELFNFIEGRTNILITTDVTSRGFNFGKQVDTIVSFDIGNADQEMNRLSRSNKINGQYIILAESQQKDELYRFFDHLKGMNIASNVILFRQVGSKQGEHEK